jgi:hypothetical protein
VIDELDELEVFALELAGTVHAVRVGFGQADDLVEVTGSCCKTEH